MHPCARGAVCSSALAESLKIWRPRGIRNGTRTEPFREFAEKSGEVESAAGAGEIALKGPKLLRLGPKWAPGPSLDHERVGVPLGSPGRSIGTRVRMGPPQSRVVLARDRGTPSGGGLLGCLFGLTVGLAELEDLADPRAGHREGMRGSSPIGARCRMRPTPSPRRRIAAAMAIGQLVAGTGGAACTPVATLTTNALVVPRSEA